MSLFWRVRFWGGSYHFRQFVYPFNLPYVNQDSILYGRQNDKSFGLTPEKSKPMNDLWLSDAENAYSKLSNNIELMHVYKDTSVLGYYDTDLTPQSQSPLGSIPTSATIYNRSSCVEQVCP